MIEIILITLLSVVIAFYVSAVSTTAAAAQQEAAIDAKLSVYTQKTIFKHTLTTNNKYMDAVEDRLDEIP